MIKAVLFDMVGVLVFKKANYLAQTQDEKNAEDIESLFNHIDDEDDKLVVTPNGEDFSDEEIEKLVEFQEKWFEHIILRAKI